MNSAAKHYPDNAKDEDIIKVLTAISIVSKRLARNIAAVSQQRTDKTGSFPQFNYVADKGHSQP